MSKEIISKYTVELAQCLEKESVDELTKFLKAHKGDFKKGFVNKWEKSTPQVKEITLYKMIANITVVNNKLRCKARKWLANNGQDANL